MWGGAFDFCNTLASGYLKIFRIKDSWVWVFGWNRIQRTTSASHFKNFKELPSFMKEPENTRRIFKFFKKKRELQLYLITEHLIFDNHSYISKSSIWFFIATVINFDTPMLDGSLLLWWTSCSSSKVKKIRTILVSVPVAHKNEIKNPVLQKQNPSSSSSYDSQSQDSLQSSSF